MKSKIALVSHLAREIEADLGTRDLTILILEAFVSAIKSFKIENLDDLDKQYKQLVYIMSNTKPKFGIILYYFQELYKDFKNGSKSKKDLIKQTEIKIKDLLDDIYQQRNLVIKYSEKINVNKKNILIHDHSHTVHDILKNFKKNGKKFNIIIAEQDYEKTHANIEVMHEAKIPFQVVPTYMISHVYENIDMAFFGALTLKDTMDFVMAPGTHGVISELYLAKIPVYNFINTRKFSLWKSSKRGETVFIHKHKRQHISKPIEYNRIKYSHDRVPLNLFHKIITNEGVLSHSMLKKSYQKHYLNLKTKNNNNEIT